ncbi:sensor histidine kinase [Nibrella saemangeumensis]
MPVFLPIGNYIFIGPRFFSNLTVFVLATLLLIPLYVIGLALLAVNVRQIFRWFPEMHQTFIRSVVMLVSLILLTLTVCVVYTFLYSQIPLFGTRFDWPTLRAICTLGLVFAIVYCLFLGVSYMYAKWQDNLQEKEELKRAALQQQFDKIKGQVNPHFLFNSLNTLTALIGENTEEAEKFVGELSKVYRYQLQANHIELTTLEAELNYVHSYAHLLGIRFGQGILFQYEVKEHHLGYCLPPATMQLLIENAVKHNIVDAASPLTITIRTDEEDQLTVSNTLQRKNLRVSSGGMGLVNISAKYRQLVEAEPLILEKDNQFIVQLPLLTPNPTNA